jgi:hypothetical protein
VGELLHQLRYSLQGTFGLLRPAGHFEIATTVGQ